MINESTIVHLVKQLDVTDLSGEKGSWVKVPHELVAVMKESCFRCDNTVIGEG